MPDGEQQKFCRMIVEQTFSDEETCFINNWQIGESKTRLAGHRKRAYLTISKSV
jgi:hypothetical protein